MTTKIDVTATPGRALKKLRSAHWAIACEKENVKIMIELYEAWAAQLGIVVDKEKNSKTREAVQADGGRASVLVGITLPQALAEQVDEMAQQFDRKRYWICQWAVNRRAPKITLEGLTAAYPNSVPSLSLVGLLALKLGLKDFQRHFAPSPGAARQAVNGTAKRAGA